MSQHTSKLSKIEEILQKEGYVDWAGGTLKKGEKENIDYDEAIIVLKKKPDGNYYIRVYADNYYHDREINKWYKNYRRKENEQENC